MADAELRALVERVVRRPRAPLAVGVVAGGRTAVVAFHSADERTLFEIGSITKVFTGVLLAALVGEGRVRLEDRLSDYVRHPLARDPALVDLATHRTGLPNVPPGFLWPELLFSLGFPGARDPHADVTRERFEQALARTRTSRRAFRYSSLGFGLLGEALARATESAYDDLVRERVCGPLGLVGTGVEPVAEARFAAGRSRLGRPRPRFRDRMLVPAGGLVSTAADLLRFVQANLAPAETPLAEALELAQAPRVRAGRGLSVGLGWLIVQRSGSATHWHNGGTWGFRSFAGLERDRERGVVVLAAQARSVDRLALRLLKALPA